MGQAPNETGAEGTPDGSATRSRIPLETAKNPFVWQRLDLVVTIGGPAARFAQKYRNQLFPAFQGLL